MGNETSSQKSRKQEHSVHADELKRDFPVLTATFVEHASKVIEDQKYLTENDLTNSLFAKIPDFGSAFFTKYHDEHDSTIGLMSFLRVGSQFSSGALNASSENLIKFYAKMFSLNEQTLNKDELVNFIKVAMQSSFVIAKLNTISLDLDQIVLSFINTLFHQADVQGCEKELALNEICSRMIENIPLFIQDLNDHVVYRLMKRTTVKKNITGKEPRDIEESNLFQTCSSNDSIVRVSGLWLVSYCVPQYFIPASEFGTCSIFSRTLENNGWHILFDSHHHGLSANGFSHKVLGYLGPTLTYFRFGTYLLLLGLDVEWRESHARIGSYNSFLYQLLPTYKVIQSGGDGCVQFNLTNRTIRKGIQCGQSKKIFLEIDSDFNQVTYDMQTFTLSRLEVWGCGGTSNYEKYVGQKQWEKRDTTKLRDRKLRPEDWKDNPDKVLLGYGGIETDHARRGDM